jgi:mRNA interferase MazF
MITSASLSQKPYPTEVRVPAGSGGLPKASAIRLDQIRTLNKRRLEQLAGHLDEEAMRQVDRAIEISLGLVPL